MTFAISAAIGTIVLGLFLKFGDEATTPIGTPILIGLLFGMTTGLLTHQGGDLMFGSTSDEPRAWTFNRLRSLATPNAILVWLMLAAAEIVLTRLRITYASKPGEDVPSPSHTLVTAGLFTLALMLAYAGPGPPAPTGAPPVRGPAGSVISVAASWSVRCSRWGHPHPHHRRALAGRDRLQPGVRTGTWRDGDSGVAGAARLRLATP
ncbi:hypothetical protein GCM10027614_19610 [Micromonospora vulcania]